MLLASRFTKFASLYDNTHSELTISINKKLPIKEGWTENGYKLLVNIISTADDVIINFTRFNRSIMYFKCVKSIFEILITL